MKDGWGHWAVVILVVFIVAVLGVASVKSYNLATLESDLFNNRLSFGCVERFSGTIKLKQPVTGAKLLITLDYTINDTDAERTVLPTDGHYSLSVRGKPKNDQTWTLRAYYFDKTGQLAETAEEFNNVGCDQQVGANIEL